MDATHSLEGCMCAIDTEGCDEDELKEVVHMLATD
jgi:hypothetical protein